MKPDYLGSRTSGPHRFQRGNSNSASPREQHAVGPANGAAQASGVEARADATLPKRKTACGSAAPRPL